MEEPQRDGTFLKNWLDRMQQESWQLELLISGFAVFLLVGGYGPLSEINISINRLLLESEFYRTVAVSYYILRTAYLALIVCLVFHVLLRGIWIAAIGLRYVSGEIEYDELNYQPRYTEWLRRNIGSFDHYLERLERYCSVIFSVAFLIIFCFLSITTYTLATVGLQAVYLWLTGGTWQGSGLLGGAGVVSLFCLLVGVLYLIDFATVGFFKRNRWTAGVYYPIYRLMGWVTLARLYRPLYHNLVDNRFGRRLARLLPVFILLVLTAISLRNVKAAYYPTTNADGLARIRATNYDDSGSEVEAYLYRTSLRSKYPVNDYVEAFVPYVPRIDDRVIRHLNPELEVGKFTGFKLRGAFDWGSITNEAADNTELLAAMGALYRVSVNDSLTAVPPRFYFHQGRKQPGLLYMLPTHDLGRGEHTLLVSKQFFRRDSLVWDDYGYIYFYK